MEGTILTNVRDLPIGVTAIVNKITGQGATRRRLMDMGITKGTAIYVRKVAPLGDPIQVMVRGYELSIRKKDAEMIPKLRSVMVPMGNDIALVGNPNSGKTTLFNHLTGSPNASATAEARSNRKPVR